VHMHKMEVHGGWGLTGAENNDNDDNHNNDEDYDDTAQTIPYTKCCQSHPKVITTYSSKCSHVSEYQN